MNPAQKRQTVMEFCVALAAAAQTGNAFVFNATQTAIEVGLLRLIPDKPTLDGVLNQQANDGR